MARVQIPPPHNLETIMDIKQAIYDHWAKLDQEPPRPHLGASIIGHECERYLFYSFHWAFAKAFGGRMHRLFEFGRQSEDRFCAELLAAGVRICQTDADGKQFNFRAPFGHFGGSMDGCADLGGEWHVVEFKTHSDKSFKELEKKGVQEAKPQHYVQMQVYMGFTGMKKALYYAENKNTSEVYAAAVEFDEAVYAWALERAKRIVFGQSPAERIGGADWYQCKWCDAYDLCHGGDLPKKNCRTCIHATAEEGGKWTCGGHELPAEVMLAGCERHVFIPSLMPFEAVDGCDDGEWIMYDMGNGKKLCNCIREGFPPIDSDDAPAIFTSAELAEIGNAKRIEAVATAKAAFGGEVQPT